MKSETQNTNENTQLQERPPDLDEVFGNLFGKLSKLFGGGRRTRKNNDASGDGGASGGGGDENSGSKSMVSVISGIVVVVWLLSGFYIVGEGTRGVELRFGAYQETTAPGPHWHLPYPIESVEKVDIDSIRSVQDKARMLTEDENIVEVEVAVQYRVLDAADYLFNVRFPDAPPGMPPGEGTVYQVMESALREAIGKAKMDFILGAGRAEIASRTKELMQQILNNYRSGIQIISVNLQQSQPPSAVQDAFADAIKAREDEIRYVNEAETYANGIVPKARGEAARMMEEASAYREKVIANSKGEASRFIQLYDEYRKAPAVTRERLYIQAVENFLRNTSKVVMDTDGSGNNSLFYLPLDRILKDRPGMDGGDNSRGDSMQTGKDEQSSGKGSLFDNFRQGRRSGR